MGCFKLKHIDSGSLETFKPFFSVVQRKSKPVGKNCIDYYPYGMLMPGRNEQANDQYLYGFQGQLLDDEIKGKGNSVNYKYRMHDPRVGRFFAVDPLAFSYPYNSPYAFSENVVINAVELEGLEKMEAFFGGEVSFSNNGETVKVTIAVVVTYDMNSDNFQLTVIMQQGVSQTIAIAVTQTNGQWGVAIAEGQTLPIRFVEAGMNSSNIAFRGLEQGLAELLVIFDAASLITEAIADADFFENNATAFEEALDLSPKYVERSLGIVLDKTLIEVAQVLEELDDEGKVDYGVNKFSTPDEIKFVPDGEGGRKNVVFNGGIQYRIESTQSKVVDKLGFKIKIDKIQITVTDQSEKK